MAAWHGVALSYSWSRQFLIGQHQMSYAFGDTTIAARRLSLLSDVFAESTREFLLGIAERQVGKAADLGCGPGYTSQLLADTLTPDQTVGLDNSESFVELARSNSSEKVSFRLHDITTEPFPSAPYDVMFCRFVLTHMSAPESVIDLWGRQLSAGGLLLIEEVEHIAMANAVLNKYIDIQMAMLSEQGNSLYIGPNLDRIADSDLLRRRSSTVAKVTVSATDAAAMFHMNLGVWRNNDFVKCNYDHAELGALDDGLEAIASGRVDASPLEWGLRHLVLERV